MHRTRRSWIPLVLAALIAAGAAAPASAASSYIPVQGRLTTAAGSPLDGSYNLTFRFYDVYTDGAPLCSDSHSVTVVQGLFSTYVSGAGCSIDGRTLYLGIEVGTDGEMSPRLYVDNTIYAWTLRPNAVIMDSSNVATVHIENAGASGRGLRSYAMSTSGENYGVVGASRSPDGYGGYFYNNEDGVALLAKSSGAGGKDAIQGESESGDGVSGIGTTTTGRGVYAGNTAAGIAIAANNSSTGNLYPTLYLVQGNADGNFVVGASTYWGTRYFRVDRTGKGFFNGGTQASGADFAEQLAVRGESRDLVPGDVLVISADADRSVERSAAPFSTAVIGVYSTRPGVLAGAPDTDGPLAGVPVAITGIVPCKVSAENGPIRRGDLLVTAATPGHAMRAGLAPPAGTVLGKAMQPLGAGTGVVEILVSAR
jgi:hypothetical protein